MSRPYNLRSCCTTKTPQTQTNNDLCEENVLHRSVGNHHLSLSALCLRAALCQRTVFQYSEIFVHNKGSPDNLTCTSLMQKRRWSSLVTARNLFFIIFQRISTRCRNSQRMPIQAIDGLQVVSSTRYKHLRFRKTQDNDKSFCFDSVP